jgi:hypothetical protein
MKGNPNIQGSVSTDGMLDFGSNAVVSGMVYLNGPSAGWSRTPPAGISWITNGNTITWNKTSALALAQFPNSGATAPGGYSYLSIHNDNSMASPAITGNSINISSSTIVTLYGKSGGANYYLTTLNTSGQSALYFDNRYGPINIWIGPVNGTGNPTLNGGSAYVSMSSDPSKAVRIYVATTNGITLTGNSELDAGVYDVTGGSNSIVNLGGTATLYSTTIISDNFSFNGTPNIVTPAGYFTPAGGGTYQFLKNWTELNGM